MDQKWLNSAETTQVGVRIATLRGLYGDLAQSLDDLETRVDIWAQIADEQDQLESLMRVRQMNSL
jgi:hypothetical protein